MLNSDEMTFILPIIDSYPTRTSRRTRQNLSSLKNEISPDKAYRSLEGESGGCRGIVTGELLKDKSSGSSSFILHSKSKMSFLGERRVIHFSGLISNMTEKGKKEVVGRD